MARIVPAIFKYASTNNNLSNRDTKRGTTYCLLLSFIPLRTNFSLIPPPTAIFHFSETTFLLTFPYVYFDEFDFFFTLPLAR